ncbi:hypothetical protein L7F22_034073 [Adiantum nelumboides]|nr:hypothetical protein [Adiantum nelumboides]
MASLFWRGLFENMGTRLKFSSSFHPQIDGQSEEANSTVVDLLKCYVSKHKGKWEQYLPLVEYAYNNTVHSSIDKAPFEIVEGGKKVPPILHTKDKIFEAHKYVQDMDEMYKKVKVASEKTQAKQKKAADRHRREVVFSLGDWVLLRFEKARLKKMKGKKRSFSKLSMRYYGPFREIISDVAYRLKLLESEGLLEVALSHLLEAKHLQLSQGIGSIESGQQYIKLSKAVYMKFVQRLQNLLKTMLATLHSSQNTSSRKSSKIQPKNPKSMEIDQKHEVHRLDAVKLKEMYRLALKSAEMLDLRRMYDISMS